MSPASGCGTAALLVPWKPIEWFGISISDIDVLEGHRHLHDHRAFTPELFDRWLQIFLDTTVHGPDDPASRRWRAAPTLWSMRLPALLLATVLSLAALAGCGDGKAVDAAGDGGTTTTTVDTGVDLSEAKFVDDTAMKKVQVDALDNNFRDQYVTVKAGTAVTFENAGRNQHNVIPVVEGSFKKAETDDFEPGTSYTVTFDEPGDFPYYCTLHGTPMKGMTGAIRVVT